MSINDTGAWTVLWLTARHKIAHAFFSTREEALTFRNSTGGELYTKDQTGALKRNG